MSRSPFHRHLLTQEKHMGYRRKRQPGDLGVLRGVAGGVAEEARTRGFPSLSFGRVGFINFRFVASTPFPFGYQWGRILPMLHRDKSNRHT
jgi:hypothetical protein